MVRVDPPSLRFGAASPLWLRFGAASGLRTIQQQAERQAINKTLLQVKQSFASHQRAEAVLGAPTAGILRRGAARLCDFRFSPSAFRFNF
jgi:hypothetical protein